MDNEKDRFIEIVKDKLTNYTLPVDDDSWNKIAERLNPAPHKNIRLWWIAAIAAAACIALLFLLFPINQKTVQQETANQLSGHEKPIIQDVPKKETVQSALPLSAESPKIDRKTRLPEQLPENNLTAEAIPEKENLPVETPSKENPKSAENQYPIPSDSNFGEEKQTPIIKNKKQRSIQLSFGSGRNLFADNKTNIQQPPSQTTFAMSQNTGYFRASALSLSQSKTEEILSYTDYPNVTTHLPLSFGVTLKKRLTRTFAVESGIVYTFLSTSFNRESSPKSHADLQLHYLGIPLNLHTRIYGDRLSKWEVYLSTGGMIEKGIYSHFLQKTYYDNINNTVQTIVSNEKIRGLQWSVNISPGVDYQIYKSYSIYLEPKLSYYFDNDQPVSARTKHPVVVGINAGVRYRW